jgi:hypothetical protein
MNVKLSVTGNVEIDNVLRGLQQVFSHKVMQAAHAEAAKPLVAKLHLLSPVGRTGKLADSQGIIKLPFTRAASLGEIHVGPRRGRFGGSHAHLIEFGTTKRNFNGANRGSIQKKQFVKPAFDETVPVVLESISLALAQKTAGFIRRQLKKNG